MSGLVLRLAGPLQSWGERSAFDVRDTAGFPTRSGLIGLIASALGRPRGASLADLEPLRFTIRIDRPGVRIVDYHTVGGGLSAGAKIPTADGKGRPPGKGTMQTWREYLSDAVFVVAVDIPDDLLGVVGPALHHPRWQPYLGRRSCPPSQPFLLDRVVADPVTELRERIPLWRRAPEEGTVAVGFVYDVGHPDAIRSEVRDQPTTFTALDRTYRTRPVWTVTHQLPGELCVSSLRTYHQQLADYLTRAED